MKSMTLVLILALLINCKKKDYREAYIGTYACQHPNGSYDVDVTIPEGDWVESSLINVAGGYATLYLDGAFSGSGSGTVYGHFSNDSLYLSYHSVCVKLD